MEELLLRKDVNKDAIRSVMQQRGITSCYHFTRIENLDSIFTHGLVARANLTTRAYVNDGQRIDGVTEANCLSIGFPNYKMFYKYRQMSGDDSLWVVLEFDSELMVDLDCAFCFSNAASNDIRFIPLQDRKTSLAFAEMFYDEQLRKSRKLPSYYTTDPQAEVLVLETIPPRYIRKIYFCNGDVQDRTFEELRNKDYDGDINVTLETATSFFTYRGDYAYWKNQGNW